MTKKSLVSNQQALEKRILKARSSIIMSSVFFSCLLVKLSPKLDEEVDTMATDGKHIYYNPEFVKTMSDPELVGVMVHEVLHCALAHHARAGDRDPMRWNIACDYAINSVIKEANFVLPADHLDDPAYHKMSAEEIYSKLPKDIGGDGSVNGNNKWNIGGVKPGSTSKEDIDKEVQTWKNAVAEAANAARMQGKLSKDLDRLVDTLLESKLPWQDLLARFVKAVTKHDFNWARPNKAYMVNFGLYLPTLHSETCGSIALAVDTSGSIGDKELAEFAAELNGILDQVRPEKVTVIYCDYSVRHVEVFTPDQYPVKLNAVGGGGTSFEPVFNYVNAELDDIQCLIYLTDMEGSFPKEEPAYPTMWVSNSKKHDAPFGQVVRMG
jgi:predicted metal-dependent peptidase